MKNGRKKIDAFDVALRAQYKYDFMIGKFLWILLMGICMLMMLIPFEANWEESLVLVTLLPAELGVFLYLRSYLIVTDGGKQVSIYQKLKWVPVSRKEIRFSRVKYLNAFCLKFFVASMLMQQLTSFVGGSFGIASLLYPIIFWLLIWLIGIGYIYSLK